MKKAIIIFACLFCACSPIRWAEKHKELVCPLCQFSNDSTFIHDTTIVTDYYEKIIPDSGYLLLYLHCDSLNNVLVDSLSRDGTIHLLYKLNKNNLKLTAYSDTIKLLHKQIEKLSTQQKTVTKYKTIYDEKIVYRAFWWLWVIIGFLLALNIVQFFKRL